VAEQQQPKFRIQDNPSISETYANKFIGAIFDGGAVTLTFGSLRLHFEKTDQAPTPDQQPVVQVTHRLTLSTAAVIELINSLNLPALKQAQAQAQAQGQQPRSSSVAEPERLSDDMAPVRSAPQGQQPRPSSGAEPERLSTDMAPVYSAPQGQKPRPSSVAELERLSIDMAPVHSAPPVERQGWQWPWRRARG
jgi:hypothetical protein